jgi:RNA polymerase sigma-70 factor (ECF subfamily)
MEADDVVQNVLFEIFRRLPAFDVRSRASFHAWVIRITDHKIADLWRAIRTRKRGEGKVLSFEDQGGRPPEDIAADGPEPSTLARIAELEEHIASVLTNLSPPDREILRLREEEGLGYDEIARRLGYQKSETIRRRYFRACTKRSRLLEGLADRFRDASGGG